MANNKRISRYDKKILRAIFLCHTGNPDCRTSKYSKTHWVKLKEIYKVWFKCFKYSERKVANTVRKSKINNYVKTSTN